MLKKIINCVMGTKRGSATHSPLMIGSVTHKSVWNSIQELGGF